MAKRDFYLSRVFLPRPRRFLLEFWEEPLISNPYEFSPLFDILNIESGDCWYTCLIVKDSLESVLQFLLIVFISCFIYLLFLDYFWPFYWLPFSPFADLKINKLVEKSKLGQKNLQSLTTSSRDRNLYLILLIWRCCREKIFVITYSFTCWRFFLDI